MESFVLPDTLERLSVSWYTLPATEPKIAKVNKKGKVTAIKKGTVIIMAKIEKSGKSVKQKLKVFDLFLFLKQHG